MEEKRYKEGKKTGKKGEREKLHGRKRNGGRSVKNQRNKEGKEKEDEIKERMK